MVFSVVPAPSCPGDACLIGAAGEPALTPISLLPFMVLPLRRGASVMGRGFAKMIASLLLLLRRLKRNDARR
jgi:hypothetical protein